MKEAFICEGIRTPIGRFGGVLSSIRTDDLAALPLKKLKEDLKDVDWESIDEVFFGNANQAGEDNTPPNLPIGVLIPSHINASFISFLKL